MHRWAGRAPRLPLAAGPVAAGCGRSASVPSLVSPQVLAIWEGSTSVLCLDVLQVLHSSPAAAAAFLHQCATRLDAALAAAERLGGTRGSAAGSTASSSGGGEAGAAALAALLRRSCLALQQRLPAVGACLRAAAAAGPASAAAQVGARDLSFDLARTFVGGAPRPAPC